MPSGSSDASIHGAKASKTGALPGAEGKTVQLPLHAEDICGSSPRGSAVGWAETFHPTQAALAARRGLGSDEKYFTNNHQWATASPNLIGGREDKEVVPD